MTASKLALIPDRAAVEWNDGTHLEPGYYPAYCRFAHIYRDPAFHRWACLLRFDVFASDLMTVIGSVPLWLNLGSKATPRAGRRSRYFTEWIRANDGPPTRNDRLSPQVFVRRMVEVKIADSDSAAPYSVVKRILRWNTGKSRINQSTNHTINKGTREDPCFQLAATKPCQVSAPPGVESASQFNSHSTSGGKVQTRPPQKGTDGASRSTAGPQSCRVHGANTVWWQRPDTSEKVCAYCHPRN